MQKIKIIANGKSFEISTEKTVSEFAKDMNLNPKKCVVELNNKALKFSEFENLKLKDGDVLEILNLVAGG